jgi:hypothetical protein
MAQTLPNQSRRLACTCTTSAGVAYDPAALTLKVFRAVGDDWTEVANEPIGDLTKTATGVFHFDYIPGEGGAYRYTYQSGDGIHVAGRFDVAYE